MCVVSAAFPGRRGPRPRRIGRFSVRTSLILFVSTVVTPFSFVYFEGAWTEEEMACVEAAAETAEASCPTGNRGRPAPWVAVSHADAGIYLASRYGRSEVLMAGSAEDLADEIRRAEQRFPPSQRTLSSLPSPAPCLQPR